MDPGESWRRLADGRILVNSVIRGQIAVRDGFIEYLDSTERRKLAEQPLATGCFKVTK
jgi:hypothetical protein